MFIIRSEGILALDLPFLTVIGCMLLITLGNASLAADSLSLIPNLRNKQHELAFSNVLKEVILGPLKNNQITLMLSEEVNDVSFTVNEAIRELNVPLSLLRLTSDVTVNVTDHLDERGSHKIPLTNVNYFDEDGDIVSSQKGGVVIAISSENDLWKPFWSPPKEWTAEAIVLLSPSPSCASKYYLEAPLTQITPSAVLICPNVPQGSPKKKSYYKVWSRKPFAEGKKLLDLGNWSSQSFRDFNDLFVDRFDDMSEKTISILANAIDRPFFYTRDNGEDAGQTYKIVEAISSWLHYDIQIASGASVNYSIMTELVQIGQNDLMFNYATPTLDRNHNFQLTVPYAYEGFGLMLEIPPPLPQWQNVIYPFSWQVWTSLVVVLTITSILFHILYHEHEKSFITNVITISQSLLSNPLDVVPTRWRVRNFLLVWWLVSWILNVSYTCNLIAILTVPVFPTKIHTAFELAESNYRLCMVDYGEFVPEALKTSTQPTFFALGAKMDMVPQLDYMPEMGEEACVELVLAGSHAHTEAYPYAATLYSMWDLDPKVYALKERLYPSYLVILIYKHAPWKHKFDVGMERLREGGLMQKWYQEAMDEFKGEAAEEASATDLKALTLSHLQGPFLMLLGGIIFGLLIMGGEVIIPHSD